MDGSQLKINQWYWIRREDGSLAPYRFHRIANDSSGRTLGQFFVGSFLRTFPLSYIVGEAQMPEHDTAE
jgi:hypothetical protein